MVERGRRLSDRPPRDAAGAHCRTMGGSRGFDSLRSGRSLRFRKEKEDERKRIGWR